MADEQFQLPPGYEGLTPTPAQPAPAAAQFQLPAGYEGLTPQTASPVAEKPGLMEDVKKAVAGPTTALGTPTPESWQKEGAGVSGVLHGNIKAGLGAIWDAERPHVVQGSPIEKFIQRINPTFQGAAT